MTEPALVRIMAGAREKLEEIRELNAVSAKLSDNRLLWSLLWPIMRQGNVEFEKKYPQFQQKDMLYDGAAGTNYGISNDAFEDDLRCNAFAGYAEIDDKYYASAADFNTLPINNKYFENMNRTECKEEIYKTVSGEMPPEFLILTETEEKHLFEIISPEALMMADLYSQLFSYACQLMHSHAPKNVGDQVDRIVFQTLFFRTVGLIGGCAVRSYALTLPDFDGPAAMYIRENTNTANSTVNQGVFI